MSFNIHSGRLRHVVEFMARLPGSDDNGDPNPLTANGEPARADVQIKSGSQLTNVGEQLTTEMITCLMWFDNRAKNSGWIRWEGINYEIQHVMPDEKKKAMMITAKVETK